MLGPVIQLDGDSCTPGKGIGPHLRPRLERHASAWTDQWELLRSVGAEHMDRDIARRVALLEQAVAGTKGAIVIGRSSGGRVATLLGARMPLRAVICLGYPFQRPGQAPEPERYTHLAHMLGPTLILQGVKDNYGGREVLERYAFSPSVTIEFVKTCHRFELPQPHWDAVASRILAFCAGLPPAGTG